MIKTLKKRLYNSEYFLFVSLLLPLIGFFVYAARYCYDFFPFLFCALLASLSYLVGCHFRLIRRHAESDLEIQDCLEKTNLLEDEFLKEQQAVSSLHRKIVNYSQLKGLTEKLCKSLTSVETSRVLSVEAGKLFGDKETMIILYLFHPKTGVLGIASSQKGQAHVNLKDKEGDWFDRWVVKTLKPLWVEDTKSDFRFDADKISTEESRKVRSLMSVPLMTGNKMIGILRVDSPRENYFVAEDIRLLATIADLGALAIENAQLYEKIEDLAIRDSLTGLYLRRHFLGRMPQEMSRCLRRKKELSFVLVDLDEFKRYNDKFGHTAGDIVLRTIGMILADEFDAPGDLVCRYGGEEFAVLLPDCSKEEAFERAEVLRKKVEAQTIILRREKTRITISVGVAAFPRDVQIKEDLIQKADMEMYRAKKQGRNRVCVTEG
ncbi:MAG: diguanylate cyclase [Candidatus Omnitrophica bacterium]|nr:diguanylate cyclase [Candidatus Omnitrophota bacterium]